VEIGNLSNSSQTYNLLRKALDASSLRSKTSANNIANVNTKGYKKYYVTFEESLKNQVDNLNLKTTTDKHISNASSIGEAKVEQDTTSSMNPDGNNVDIDSEMANQAANTMMYNALITQVNSKLSLERYIINGGK
jgi:flagellar basal-body rod protein FlgB